MNISLLMIIGVIFGAAVGAAIALLFTPSSGVEVRTRIGQVIVADHNDLNHREPDDASIGGPIAGPIYRLDGRPIGGQSGGQNKGSA